jgi:hypothetical protein
LVLVCNSNYDNDSAYCAGEEYEAAPCEIIDLSTFVGRDHRELFDELIDSIRSVGRVLFLMGHLYGRGFGGERVQKFVQAK